MPRSSCGSCRALLSTGDHHLICALCLGREHTAIALSMGGCPECDKLSMSTLRARLEAFNDDAVTPPVSVGPRRKKCRSQRPPETDVAPKSSPEPFLRASFRQAAAMLSL